MLNIIKASLWGGDVPQTLITSSMYAELKLHSIEVLPASIINKLNIVEDIKDEWYKDILQKKAYYCHYKHEEVHLPLTVPYVILKGSAASKYYPHPESRIMGDIDIITRRQDYDTAYHELINHGYIVKKRLDREIGLVKNGVMVELHRYFSLSNDTNKAKYLDDLIIDNISDNHYLPDLINGLVLLEHIDQHMEGGIGLRQVVDWMMFVDQCLSEEKWPEFREMVVQIGLEKLAIVITKMCEIYLGLSPRAWSMNADTLVCEELMNYVLSCGNFGNKRIDESSIVENAFTYARSHKAAIKLLNDRGLANWEAAKNHTILRPFAWIYQAFRYAHRGLTRKAAIRKLFNEYDNAKKRDNLFETLGIKRVSKGRAVYKDGKYITK